MRLAVAVGLAMLAITAWSRSGLPMSNWGVISLLLGSVAIGFALDMLADRKLSPSSPRERQSGGFPGWAFGAGIAPALLVAVLGDPTSVWPALAGMAGIGVFFVVQAALLRIFANS